MRHGCILLGAPLDLFSKEYDTLPGSDEWTTDVVRAFWDDRGAYRQLSPIYLLHRDLPPMLLIVGEKDVAAIVLQAERFVAAARKKGADAQLHVSPGRDHKAIVFELGEDNDPELPVIEKFLETH